MCRNKVCLHEILPKIIRERSCGKIKRIKVIEKIINSEKAFTVNAVNLVKFLYFYTLCYVLAMSEKPCNSINQNRTR